MVHKSIYAVGAALAAATMSPAANASVSITCPAFSGDGVCTFYEAQATGVFSDAFREAQSFEDMFKLILTQDYALSINGSFVGAPITFTLMELFNSADISLGAITMDSSYSYFNLQAGTYTLKMSGSTTGRSSYSGNVHIVPVPEPAAWSLMAVGIAALGFTMRQRGRTRRVTFA